MSKKIYKTYKFRIYPTINQIELINKTFNCCRFIYNYFLALSKQDYQNFGKRKSIFEYKKQISILKKDHTWLKDVDSCALNNSLFNLDYAYQMFFNGSKGYPAFKKKKDSQTFYKTSYSASYIKGKKYETIKVGKNYIKIQKVGYLKSRGKRLPTGKILHAIVKRKPSGKYYISIVTEEIVDKKPLTNQNVCFDLGIKDFITMSDGKKYKNLQNQALQNKLSRLHRKLSKKKYGSVNYQKQLVKIGRVYEKIVNSRINYEHWLSSKIINENKVIISEDLDVKEMMSNKNISSYVADCSWSRFLFYIEYKSFWYGRTYLKIDRYFPSSQLCSNCNYINKNIKNCNVRKWTCPKCGQTHDRDINAAVNILHEGLRLI